METILRPTDELDAESFILAHPLASENGAFITKIFRLPAQKRLGFYLESSSASIRQRSKPAQFELVFDKKMSSSESMLRWLKQFQKMCLQWIIDKHEDWFDSNITIDDVRLSFQSILAYENDSSFVLPISVGTKCPVYNDLAQVLLIQNVLDGTPVVAILQFTGLKFIDSRFSFIIDAKQLMVIDILQDQETLREQEKLFSNPCFRRKIRASENSDSSAADPHKTGNQAPLPLLLPPTLPSLPPTLPSLPHSTAPPALPPRKRPDELHEIYLSDDDDDGDDDDAPVIALRDREQVYQEMYATAKNKQLRKKSRYLQALKETQKLRKKYSIQDQDAEDDEDQDDDEDEEDQDEDQDEETEEEEEQENSDEESQPLECEDL